MVPRPSRHQFPWRRRWSAAPAARRKTGIRLGTYCEPDDPKSAPITTGPMTRDELKDLACLGFSADW